MKCCFQIIFIKNINQSSIKNLAIIIAAVSYTHLDVYKRQVQECPTGKWIEQIQAWKEEHPLKCVQTLC